MGQAAVLPMARARSAPGLALPKGGKERDVSLPEWVSLRLASVRPRKWPAMAMFKPVDNLGCYPQADSTA